MLTMHIRPDVQQALTSGAPVLALESTIISHGLPYPDNVACARTLERIARECGVTPATIAIIDGTVSIGITDEELLRLAQSDNVAKVSRADIAAVVAQRRMGTTTVAGTMILAAMAGIRFFATGGIGGAHRGAESTFDISADLEELARTPVGVISAGAKAILDIPKTLEYLETRGVPVIGYGTDSFPLFYTRSSSYRLNLRADDAATVARIAQAQFATPQLAGGLLIANPIPAESELPPAYIDDIIAQAVRAAEQAAVAGKQVTPFLLARIAELTGKKSIVANLALIENNVRVGCAIATAYAALKS
jgi:pseudouridylate synthase